MTVPPDDLDDLLAAHARLDAAVLALRRDLAAASTARDRLVRRLRLDFGVSDPEAARWSRPEHGGRGSGDRPGGDG